MINKVTLIGNVGADPEIRTLENGTKVARIRLATTEKLYNPVSKESRDHTEWHSVTLWRGLADVADRFVRKGSQIYIEGSLRSNEWTDAEGVKRYGIEILGRELKMLGRRPEGQGDNLGASSGATTLQSGSYSGGSSGAVGGTGGASSSNGDSSNAPLNSADEIDDLPF